MNPYNKPHLACHFCNNSYQPYEEGVYSLIYVLCDFCQRSYNLYRVETNYIHSIKDEHDIYTKIDARIYPIDFNAKFELYFFKNTTHLYIVTSEFTTDSVQIYESIYPENSIQKLNFYKSFK